MKRPRGQILLLAVMTVAAVSTLGIIAVGMTVSANTTVRTSKERAIARSAAEAGIERALYKLNSNPNYAGETTTLGGGAYTVTVTAIDSTNKRVDAYGYFPSAASPKATRHLRIRGGISTAAIAFNYGVQVGQGGVFMKNGTSIIGNLYANGTVCGTNDAQGTSCDGHSNGTVTGALSVAPGANLDAKNEQYAADETIGQTGGTETAAAESFKPGSSDSITQVALYLKKVGTPSDLTIRIQTDTCNCNGGSPTTTVLGSGTLDAERVSSAYSWVVIPLSTPATVTSGTQYWVSLDTGTASDNYFVWGKDSNSGYGNGVGRWSTGWDQTPWTLISGDLDFRIYLAGTGTKIDSLASVVGDARAATISNSTITNGDAYYQTIASSTVRGSACPNAYCHATGAATSIQPLPVTAQNISDWEASATAGGVLTGNQTISTTQTIGPVKIVGDLNLTPGNNQVITIGGAIWVVGNITVNGNNNSIVRLPAASGATSTVVVADDPSNPTTKGQISFPNGSNTDVQGSGTSGSYIMFLSTYAGSPPNDAIAVGTNAAAAIFYATAGRITISNNAQLKEVTGYQLYIKQGTITYESGLANAQFTTGPGAVWTLADDSWQELVP